VNHTDPGTDSPIGQLSTRISAATLAELDRWNPEMWEQPESDGLQNRIEREVIATVKRWMIEQGISLRDGVRYRDDLRRT
jgi:hypothetical protein